MDSSMEEEEEVDEASMKLSGLMSINKRRWFRWSVWRRDMVLENIFPSGREVVLVERRRGMRL